MHGHQSIQSIDLDIAQQSSHRLRMRFEGPASRTAYTRREHRVGADVRSNIEKKVIGSKEMQQECHLGELVKSDVDIAGRTGHAAPHRKARIADPGHDNFVLQAALNLPGHEAPPRPIGRRLRKRVGTEECIESRNGVHVVHLHHTLSLMPPGWTVLRDAPQPR